MVKGEEASKRSLKLKPVRMHHPRGSGPIGAAHTVAFSSGRQCTAPARLAALLAEGDADASRVVAAYRGRRRRCALQHSANRVSNAAQR